MNQKGVVLDLGLHLLVVVVIRSQSVGKGQYFHTGSMGGYILEQIRIKPIQVLL
jgi:hypothetical protein